MGAGNLQLMRVACRSPNMGMMVKSSYSYYPDIRSLEVASLEGLSFSLSGPLLPVTLGGSLPSPRLHTRCQQCPPDLETKSRLGRRAECSAVGKEGGWGSSSWVSGSKYLCSAGLCQAQCWVW